MTAPSRRLLSGLLAAALMGCQVQPEGAEAGTTPGSVRSTRAAALQELAVVQSWSIQLTNYTAGLKEVGASKAGLVVVEPEGDGERWTPAEVAAAAQGRLLFGYLSVGQAENYRSYWQSGWRPGTPAWLQTEDPDWPGDYRVAYWDPAWQAIMLRQLDALQDQGFEGVFLDLVDAYELFPQRATARQDMARWVCTLAEHARRRNPGFLLMTQNAMDIIEEPGYAACVDATNQEETYYYATDVPVDQQRYRDLMHWDPVWRALGKPTFTLEYATQPAHVERAYAQARADRLIPYVTVRALDRLP
ncbi:MJ1477/TM1410 family putative glycoside hydrolase [Deinococcus sonorensis]|uniref:MJ1477/TM1410 family putative glycoside hydrolase n=2 Tax=Deinococcus sonorensis TaxID=309891 RepID=A0AAU7UAP5_9DEIO